MTIQGLRGILLEEGRREPHEIDLRRIQDAIDDYRIDNAILASDEQKVLEYIERKFDVLNCLNNRTRVRRYTWARWCFWWYLRNVKKETLQHIGFKYGYNHASVLHGLKEVDENHKTNGYYKEICIIKSKLS